MAVALQNIDILTASRQRPRCCARHSCEYIKILHNMVRLSESKRSQTAELRESSASTIACTSCERKSVPGGRACTTTSEVLAGNLFAVWSNVCARCCQGRLTRQPCHLDAEHSLVKRRPSSEAEPPGWRGCLRCSTWHPRYVMVEAPRDGSLENRRKWTKAVTAKA